MGNELDRSAAVAIRAMDRPDLRALRSRLEVVARAIDDLTAAQDEEIFRLRRLIVITAARYRDVAEKEWKSVKRTNALVEHLRALCLEADAIAFAGDLPPKRRPAPRRKNG